MAELSVLPFLLFQGNAKEAMAFYTSLFPDSAVTDVAEYGPGEPGAAGSIKKAKFVIGNQSVLCTDSVVKHAFTFTPAFSFFVECGSEAEIDRLSAALESGGQVFMPLDVMASAVSLRGSMTASESPGNSTSHSTISGRR
jgi:predicted 3-demethylubiquinone-9 3-methyltransferase (glyoxalase superfamily)